MNSSPLHRLQTCPSPQDDVQIWLANLDSLSADELRACVAVLDPSERARAERFRFPQDRHHYEAARGLVRYLLGTTLGKAPAEVAIVCGPHGKPMLRGKPGEPGLHFNLSHSAGRAIFALSWSREVGVDLEAAANLSKDLDHLAARILSPRELKSWRNLSNTELRGAEFLRAWTRKEACVKAIGQGLGIDVRKIEVIDTANAQEGSLIEITVVESDHTRWLVRDVSVPAGFAAALAVPSHDEAKVHLPSLAQKRLA